MRYESATQIASDDEGVKNPFEDFEPPGNPSGACRTIEVTAAMRQQDALTHKPDFVSAYSAFRATLSVDNLKLVRSEVSPGRSAETRKFVLITHVRGVRHSGRICEGDGCSKELSCYTDGNLCLICFNAKRAADRLARSIARRAAGKRESHPVDKKVQNSCVLCPRLLRPGRPAGPCCMCKNKLRAKKYHLLD